jgi:flagellar basal-body rod protein FlgG
MNNSFFTGAIGAHQQLKELNLLGNNIANVNTYGFKAERGRFAALMYDEMTSINDDYQPYGVGAAMWETDTEYTQGATLTTGRAQDYMIEGDGFFVLVDMETGEMTLTRNGSFEKAELVRDTGEVDENGDPITESIWYLSDGEGRFVLSDVGGLIEMDDINETQPVGIYDYINYNGMSQMDDTRFEAVEKNGTLRMGTGTLIHGALEQSNVDLADQMTQLIESQRAYGLALKVVSASDEIETTINSLRS